MLKISFAALTIVAITAFAMIPAAVAEQDMKGNPCAMKGMGEMKGEMKGKMEGMKHNPCAMKGMGEMKGMKHNPCAMKGMGEMKGKMKDKMKGMGNPCAGQGY
jgi:hypothetical protein